MPEPDEPTALYRYFDADDVLLYVGISNAPDIRAKAHLYERRPASWPKRAVRRTDEWHDSRKLALDAERVTVQAEKPLYNRTHNYDDAAFDPASWPTVVFGSKVEQVASLIRNEIASGRWRAGQRLPSIRRMTEATGASQPVVSKASTRLRQEGLLVFESGRGLFVATAPAPTAKLPHNFFWELGFPG
ncbi:winged helix-turn-helix domain-containing protein [Streptomyces sp. NBC_00006]|uniref:winged helix-turn-helix domain-containing protein n=1 Tax=Streptomyces sp. NBC_00006 TaxID=2975619 RepID=UPI002256920D|nr:winged helix-turn-helix domain-containing protein [Streptomyces sp. NBC_00006]MCX5528968.1 winged helix-turn-helix domain-containing protein [Streptomyces sp. NBC_00006]MCX5537800.1 winged helix-turn-helix domain-containing protein [Streptomyces sp. NBC_00006]